MALKLSSVKVLKDSEFTLKRDMVEYQKLNGYVLAHNKIGAAKVVHAWFGRQGGLMLSALDS